MPRRDHIQLSDAELAAWLDTQREPDESRGRCAGRLLREHRSLTEGTTADLLAALREIRDRAAAALGEVTTTP